MNENIEFLKAFLKNPGKVGSITPSSPELARKMIEGITPRSDNTVLELGVGTGAITRFLQEIVSDDESYLGIELDADLVRSFGRNYPDMKIVQGSACDAAAIHTGSGIGKIGYIICSLPFASLPSEVGKRIFLEIEKFMQQGCTLRTFQYAHSYYFPSGIRFRESMSKRYGKSKKSRLIVKNVPPAYTLTWSSV